VGMEAAAARTARLRLRVAHSPETAVGGGNPRRAGPGGDGACQGPLAAGRITGQISPCRAGAEPKPLRYRLSTWRPTLSTRSRHYSPPATHLTVAGSTGSCVHPAASPAAALLTHATPVLSAASGASALPTHPTTTPILPFSTPPTPRRPNRPGRTPLHLTGYGRPPLHDHSRTLAKAGANMGVWLAVSLKARYDGVLP
jgi:hypothetical protein